jgi:DHA1 family bicyclomycin/chloramphenicol resistance-like MFS transporter
MTHRPAPASGGLATILALAAISAMGSMAIHMLVPALPALANDLRIRPEQAQLAISVYLGGLGTGQLLAGPLVDRIGRRPVLLAGLALYIVGALVSALAPGLPTLLAARLVQAVGGAAGVVTSRVMVSDIFGREESARRQATLMMIVLVSPAFAPVVGGMLVAIGGWRLVPAVLTVTAALAMLVALLRLPETRIVTRAPAGASLPRNLARLIRNRQFVLATLALAGGSSALYMFLASAPFLLVRGYGLSESEAGLCFLVVAFASICGTRVVGPLARRTDALRAGAALILTGALAELALAAAGFAGPLPLVAPMLLLGLGAGIVGPSAITVVLFAEDDLAGTATSIAGAIQMLASALATVVLGRFGPLDPLRLALALVLSSSVAFAATQFRLRHI